MTRCRVVAAMLDAGDGSAGWPAVVERVGGDAGQVADGHQQDQGLDRAGQARPVDRAGRVVRAEMAGDDGEGLGDARWDRGCRRAQGLR
jgi:hypothetical protein